MRPWFFSCGHLNSQARSRCSRDFTSLFDFLGSLSIAIFTSSPELTITCLYKHHDHHYNHLCKYPLSLELFMVFALFSISCVIIAEPYHHLSFQISSVTLRSLSSSLSSLHLRQITFLEKRSQDAIIS